MQSRPRARPGDEGPPPDEDGGAPSDPEQVARTILLRRLDHAPRSRAELAETLAQRGVPEEAAARVLDRFEEVGLIDDRLFARMWVQSRQVGRGLAGRALAAELRRRGVGDEAITEALEAVTPDLEAQTARDLARRRALSMAGVPYATAARRLTGFLARKGYGPGIAGRVVRDVLSELRSEEVDDTVAAEHLRFS